MDRSVDTAEYAASNEEWLSGGRAAALESRAFCASSSRGGHNKAAGGTGWILAPDGRTLARTSGEEPFVTAEVDLMQVRTVS
jgi:predicted amidohydrolase